jgi:thiamine biosynthesis lipoprotein
LRIRVNPSPKNTTEGRSNDAATTGRLLASIQTAPTDTGAVAVFERIRATTRVSFNAGWHHVSFQALGSPCRVQLVAPKPSARALLEEIVRWVAAFEARYSRFIPTSLVCRINDAAGKEWVGIDPETEQLFALCQEMHFITRGVFDPTALPLVRLWDWKANPPVVPDDRTIEAAMKKVGWRKVQRAPGKVYLPEPGMALDLGGVGKEYAVDQVLQLAVTRGATSLLVDFGHDVRVHGPAPENKPAWHIGLEDPHRPGKCWTGLAVTNQAVATSGDYLRNFVRDGRRYGHIIDLRTGRPVANGCRAVSVMAPNCTLAGMLSTTALVLGPEEGVRLLDATYQVEGCIIAESGKIPSRRFYEYATR